MEYSDARWREDSHTIGSVRGTSYYALGLLLRNGEGDRDRTIQAIESLCTLQYNAPGKPYHGTYHRSPNDKQLPKHAMKWKDYDPNWREFIGTHLALILQCYEDRLPEDTIDEIDASLKLAAAGAHGRNVAAEYTNISAMSAYLLAYTGKRFNNHDWRNHGRKLAKEIFENYSYNENFDENNSPTYYGVDLFGFALWRAYPPSPEFEKLGREMELGLWRDIARFYHADLKNNCGPFDRSYGMDVNQYVALQGMFMAMHLPAAFTPLPAIDSNDSKGLGEICCMPGYAMVKGVVPDEILKEFIHFSGPRNESRPIGRRGKRIATAWLGDRVMMGGGTPLMGRPAIDQAHPATIHWLTSDNEIAWMRLRCSVRVTGVAKDGSLSIQFHMDKPHRAVNEVQFECNIPGEFQNKVTPTQWQLDGLVLDVESPLKEVEVKQNNRHFVIAFPLSDAQQEQPFAITLRLAQ